MTRFSTTPPPALSAAVTRLLEARPRRDLAERAARISAIYRAGGTSAQAIADEQDALAYALFRLPATYAAAIDAFGRLAARAPEFRPRRMLDLGAGLGTASLAALEVWPELEEIVLLDRSETFLALARKLAAAPGAALGRARFIAADMADPPDLGGSFDLVASGYALTECPEPRLDAAIDAAWRACGGALVLVEPGTPRDYVRLMRARARLVASGARIALPCPHSAPCPLAAPDWCHFSVRLARTRDHRLVKAADAPFEDEKFAYLVAAREAAPIFPASARVLARPEPLKYGLRLRLCAKEGIAEFTILERDKRIFDPIKKSAWGDEIVAPAPRE